MAIVEKRCLIRTDLSTAFRTSQDYDSRCRWDPFAKRIQRKTNGEVTVTAWHGMKMQVEYISWRPTERAAVRMAQGPFPLKVFAGTWIFRQHTPGFVETCFRYQVKMTRTWYWLEPLIVFYFSWETGRRLSGLKRYLEK